MAISKSKYIYCDVKLYNSQIYPFFGSFQAVCEIVELSFWVGMFKDSDTDFHNLISIDYLIFLLLTLQFIIKFSIVLQVYPNCLACMIS
jgi:hypothetical protein